MRALRIIFKRTRMCTLDRPTDRPTNMLVVNRLVGWQYWDEPQPNAVVAALLLQVRRVRIYIVNARIKNCR